MKNKDIISFVILIIASIAFLAGAILKFINHDSEMLLWYIFLGCMFLVLAIMIITGKKK